MSVRYSGAESARRRDFVFTSSDFERVRVLIRERAGIVLSDGKQEMVYSRLARRLREKNLASFEAYLDALEGGYDSAEWEAFTNALTTNLTSFFREAHHFPMLAEHVRQVRTPLTLWCAAASTGEEPYSIAMTVCEAFDSMTPPVEIIATDIDTKVLETAVGGVYPMERLKGLSPERIKRFFLKGRGASEGLARVRPELEALITFRQVNLLEADWPVKGPFDAVFCRNVMIYFDKPTQRQLLTRLAPLMKPDGLLFAGHSENLTQVTDAFRIRSKTVYELKRRG